MADNEEGDENLPRDAKIVKALLRSMGVGEYEPCVIHQFLELWYRYVVDVLTDSQVYSEHAGKSVIDVDDVKLAIQTKVNFSFSQPPPRERFINMYASTLQNHALLRFIHALFTLYSQILLELARNRNKIPLSKSIDGPGIPLPPEEDTLISPNYQLAIPKKQLPQAAEETEEDEEAANQNPPQEPKTDQQQQQTQQRVSFSLVGKRGG